MGAIIAYITAHLASVSAIALVILRLLESIEAVIADGKVKNAIGFVIAVIKEIFKFG